MAGTVSSARIISLLPKSAVLFAVFAVAHLGSLSAHADIAGREEGSFQFLLQSASPPKEGVRIQNQYPGFEYDVGWQVEDVEGKAVTFAQIMWWFPQNMRFPLPQPPGGNAPMSQIPETIWRHIALYDLKFQVILYRKGTPGKRYSLIMDLGIPNDPGEKKWSLNVPVVRAWDRLLTHYEGPGQNNDIYLTADEAIALINPSNQTNAAEPGDKNTILVENSWLLDPQMSTVDFNHELLTTRLDWHADIMVRAIRDQVGILKNVVRLPTEKIELRLGVYESLLHKDMVAIPDDLQHLFDKLNSGVPEKYISPARRAYYHKERLRIIEKAKREELLLSLGRYVDDYPVWFNNKLQDLGLE
ncbi:hypothetical protein [Kiloniella sp.]|uniref:hypothetical protein n=1 Tax=Kiloniella sp. TaxID=1938587 RepID=UPI003B02E048